MCVKCAIDDAVNANDWDEVARLAREEKKAAKADEADEAPAADDSKPKAASSKGSSKS